MDTITFGIDAAQCWKDDADHFGGAVDAVCAALTAAFPNARTYVHSTDDAPEGCPDNAAAHTVGRSALDAHMAAAGDCVCGSDHDCRSEGCDDACPACCG